MKILIIGTGAEIPPKGWGAVESIITEHLIRIPKFGVEVDLINTLDWWSLASMVKEKQCKYDFIHAHYDIMWPYLKCISATCPIGMSSHFPFITMEEHYSHFGYWQVMNYFLDPTHKHLNFCISQRDVEYFISKGADPNKMYRIKLGAPESINFKINPIYPGKTMYLGKICQRKCQEVYGEIKSIDFAGNISGEDPNANTNNLHSYLGEWSKDQVHNELTNYANLALISHGEDTPLVVREALIAGLGVVVSESASNELDTSMPFISVIPNNKMGDIKYVEDVLCENRAASLSIRGDIRQYGIDNFGWDSCVRHYISEIERAIECQK